MPDCTCGVYVMALSCLLGCGCLVYSINSTTCEHIVCDYHSLHCRKKRKKHKHKRKIVELSKLGIGQPKHVEDNFAHNIHTIQNTPYTLIDEHSKHDISLISSSSSSPQSSLFSTSSSSEEL